MSTALDSSKYEAFGNRMVDVMNSAATALSISLGHRTGLLDAMAALPAATPSDIAAAAGLNERYVREWLGAMWGRETALRMLADAGFGDVRVESLPHDPINLYYVVRPKAVCLTAPES